MSEKPTAADWSDVDKAADTGAYSKYLDTIRTFDATTAYKVRTIEQMRLAPGGRALDAGCGTGEDAKRALDQVGPSGHVWGVDFSAAMIEECKRRWSTVPSLEFKVADAHALDFEDNSFDATRSDRVFQHLADPVKALSEMVRVTKPGGRVVIADPDWGTYAMDLDRTPASEAFLDLARGQARNPWIGRQLRGMFLRAGLVEVDVIAHTLFVLDYATLDRMGNIDAGFVAAVEAGRLTEADVAQIKADMRRRQDEGSFLMCAGVFTVSGTKKPE